MRPIHVWCSKSSQTGAITWETVMRLWGEKRITVTVYQTCHVICGSLLPKQSHPFHTHTWTPTTIPEFQVRMGKELVEHVLQTSSWLNYVLFNLWALALAADSCAVPGHYSNTIPSTSAGLTQSQTWGSCRKKAILLLTYIKIMNNNERNAYKTFCSYIYFLPVCDYWFISQRTITSPQIWLKSQQEKITSSHF